ncbi:MAG TPA: protoporphyrinogen oxidase [Polyangiaceae bacterium]|nr:protoporphyrinogen oxidase [Polyangiaceae bacterium]
MTDEGDPRPHVVVAGGGITGLATAHRLLERGQGRVRVTVLEASTRFGGKIRTVRRDGLVLDGGPDAFVTTKPHAAALARELGLGDRLIETTPENRRVYFRMGGKSFHLPEGLVLAVPTRFWPLVKSPLFSMGGLARMGLDLVLPAKHDDGDESIASFLRRRLGREAAERLGDPLLGGIYAGDPERLSLRATFPQLIDLETQHRSLVLGALAGRRAMARRAAASERSGAKTPPKHPPSPFLSFLGGMSELWEATLASVEKRGGVTRTETRIAGVRPTERGVHVTATSPRGNEEIHADHLVLALPALTSASILSGLDDEAAGLVRAIPHVSSATCLLAFPESAIDHPLDGVGMLIPKSEGRQAIALTFVTSKWRGRAPTGTVVLRVFLGGYSRPEIASFTDDDVLRTARGEVSALLGVRGEPITHEVFRWSNANPQPVVGHLDRVARVTERMSRFPAVTLAGAAFHGVGVPDCVKRGEEVASSVLAQLDLAKDVGRSRSDEVRPS